MRVKKSHLTVLSIFIAFFLFQSPLLQAQTYCAASGDDTNDLGIILVQIGENSNGSGVSDYSYNSEGVFASLTQGTTYSYSITYQNSKEGTVVCHAATYIDWDGNGLFDDGCVLHCSNSYSISSTTGQVQSGTFTVPIDAAEGTTRMRVGVVYDSDDVLQRVPACGSGYDGEYEDYIIEVQAASGSYTISGNVSGSGGRGALEGVLISFSDTHTTTTDSDGNYSYTVDFGWTGTVAPTMAGNTFTPPFANIGPVTENVTQDFTASISTVTVSGVIQESGGTPVAGVTVGYSGGSTVTNSSGGYSFTVTEGWSGTVTPSLAGWRFTPTSRSYSNLLGDTTFQNYTALRSSTRFTISGRVTHQGVGLEGVVLDGLTGGPVTDASGNYSVRVKVGWSGTVTPVSDGYSFTPSAITYTNVSFHYSNQNYTTVTEFPAVSGSVYHSDGTGIEGVTLTFSDGGGSIVTGVSGAYSHEVGSGWSGTVTPSLGGYAFNPSSRTYTGVTANITNQDYVFNSSGTPFISLTPLFMNFGVDTAGTANSSQVLQVNNSGGGIMNWTLEADQAWLACTPGTGTGDGRVTVSVDPAGLAAGVYSGNLTVTCDDAFNSPRTVPVSLKVLASTESPFGTFATPLQGETYSGSVALTGWALDDIGVERLEIHHKKGSSMVYVGDAVFIEGARSDIEILYPGYPNNHKAGWGYMLLTHALPNGGNGTYTLYARAVDVEGHVTTWSKAIQVNNNQSAEPFGTIDTPAQGAAVSGSDYVNWGWVLTPLPNTVPVDGSTINVWVDGVMLGNPVYNLYRSDIASMFPGYNNSDGAVGYFSLDTTAYANGVHSIYWTAADDAGNSAGIGSRFFTIANTAGVEGGVQEISASPNQVRPLPIAQYAAPLNVALHAPVLVKQGYRSTSPPQVFYPNNEGLISLAMSPGGRLELQLTAAPSVPGPGSHLKESFHRGPGGFSGFQVVGNRLRRLPLGSTFDAAKGIFYWQPGPGFAGEYRLVFIIRTPEGALERKDVAVKID